MDVKKQLLSFTRLLLPAVGVALTCTGAYIVSLQNDYDCGLKLVLVYVMIAFGFLAMLIGVFWSLCHSMKSKIYQRRRRPERHIQIFTIERPNHFPPSYDDSQRRSPLNNPPEVVVSVDRVDMVVSLAPPLYSQDGSEAPDCTWSWEHPPRYSVVVQATDTGEQRELFSPQ